MAGMSLTLHDWPPGHSLALAQSCTPAQADEAHVAVTVLWPTSQPAQQYWPEAQLAALEHDREPPTVVQEPLAAHAPVHAPEIQQSCDERSQVPEPHWMRPVAVEPSGPKFDASPPLPLPLSMPLEELLLDPLDEPLLVPPDEPPLDPLDEPLPLVEPPLDPELDPLLLPPLLNPLLPSTAASPPIPEAPPDPPQWAASPAAAAQPSATGHRKKARMLRLPVAA
jgi:hypothetical protein